MHSTGMTHEERNIPIPEADRNVRGAQAPDRAASSSPRGEAHTMDLFFCPTLLDFVVDFLERYPQSPYRQR